MAYDILVVDDEPGLREKLEADPSHPKYLKTVRGLGYRLVREERP